MIASAAQRGFTVYVYDENGETLFTKFGELVDFSSESVLIRIGLTLSAFDDRGNAKFIKSV